MPTANGTITRASYGTQFVGDFVIDGEHYIFTGNTSSPGDEFYSPEAELTYAKIGDLTARRLFEGKLGKKSVRLEVANGPVMSGDVTDTIDPASTVVGSGTWTRGD